MKTQGDNKIKHPYKAPEGYFENFEERLREKLPVKAPLFVSHNSKKRRFAYLFAAAALLLLASFAWLIFSKNPTLPLPEMVKKPELQKQQSDSVELKTLIEKHGQNEEKLMEHIADEIHDEPTFTPVVMNSSEKQIADELEEEGIIAAEINDNLFDEFEILP